MNEVVILDVGHGNAAVIRHGDHTVVVDAPLRDRIVDVLRAEGVKRVRLVVASHSDSDHCGGFIGLLLAPDIVVDEFRVNADATRFTNTSRKKYWGDLKAALQWANSEQGTRLRTELTAEVTDDISLEGLRLEVLLPEALLTMDGVGAQTAAGKVITPNAMSAVIRVVLEGDPLVLLTGDMDAEGLKRLVDAGQDIKSRVLVFPHHGGLPEGAAAGAKLAAFATDLMQMCAPQTVIFSLARVGHANPRPEIVSAVRAAGAGVHIACTQLSTHCSADLLADDGHLSSRPASGQAKGRCCLGSAVLLPGTGLASPTRAMHEQAVAVLPARLCL